MKANNNVKQCIFMIRKQTKASLFKTVIHYSFEPVREKTNNVVSDHVQHKPGCTVTEDGSRLEILDLESRGIVLSMQQKKGAEQLRSYVKLICAFGFAYTDCWFSHAAAHM